MAYIKIHRGSHQIGGCCTEITVDDSKILIDLGANLPGMEEEALITDDELCERVFDDSKKQAVLFSHYHGDHIGLYKKIPKGVDMYIGPLAKEILKIVTPYIDYSCDEKGIPIVENMIPYKVAKDNKIVEGIKVHPFYVDHSALDAYMFYIEAGGKKILFTGDFREHGICGEKDRLWRTIDAYIPKDIDILITEGTMLSRTKEVAANVVKTEKELGLKAAEYFKQKKYNFVIVSSTNCDSIMEFYHNTPKGMQFVCDKYQAKIILTAMKGMEKKGYFKSYRTSNEQPAIYILNYKEEKCKELVELGKQLETPLEIKPANSSQMYENGFVMLTRKNSFPENKNHVFTKILDKFYSTGNGQIIYSMWNGYLEGDKADENLLRLINGRPIIELHTSGHAYVETIAKLIKAVNPKVIIPMHTECADSFVKIEEFKEYHDRIVELQDGEKYTL